MYSMNVHTHAYIYIWFIYTNHNGAVYLALVVVRLAQAGSTQQRGAGKGGLCVAMGSSALHLSGLAPAK